MSSISLGVAALVAIDSFSANIIQSVKDQSRALMGGDVSFNSNKPLPPAVDSLFDSLSRKGVSFARVTTFPSMAVVPRTTGTRFVQVRGVTDNYPFYGKIITEPAGRWPLLQQGANAIVDPSLLASLNARVGDTLRLNFGTFTIVATIKDVPGAAGIAEMLGPRVFIPAKYIAETQLLVFGSIAERTVLARLPAGTDPDKFLKPLKARLDQQQVRSRSVTQSEMATADAIENLSDFIGIVGLVALLLGGIGVASGVRAFVARKIDTVAVLRRLERTSTYDVRRSGGGHGTRRRRRRCSARRRGSVCATPRADRDPPHRRAGLARAERSADGTRGRRMDRAHLRASAVARASQRLTPSDPAS